MGDVETPSLNLRPFQREAVDHFFSDTAADTQVLLAPIGTGKSATASGIAAEALRRGASGVAVLATKNVVAQGIAWRAAGHDLTPFELHRAVALSTSTSPTVRWPRRVLTFGSLRQAARDPIAHAFRARAWDLVIADLGGGRDEDAQALKGLFDGARMNRVLALGDASALESRWSWLGAAPLAYDVPDVADASAPPINFSVVEYERTPNEIDLARRAQQLTMDFRRLGLPPGARLPAAASSSPLASQSQAWAAADSLRHLRNRLAHGLPGQPEDGPSQVLGADRLPELERLRADLMRFGDDVDLLEVDSKWEAFVSELRRVGPSGVAVFCDFAETAVYVTDRLEAVGIPVASPDDGGFLDRSEERPDAVFVSRDELLLGSELGDARVAINYDLPPSQRRAHIRWSRLDWSQADPPARMITLLDRKSASPTEKMAFTQLRYMVRDE